MNDLIPRLSVEVVALTGESTNEAMWRALDERGGTRDLAHDSLSSMGRPITKAKEEAILGYDGDSA
ncbi:hypothetical protein [Gemmatimonas sp.]